MTETVVIEKLVHGGQGIGTLADGRRVFVWNALPGETVEVRLTKSKNKLAEGIAETVTVPVSERETPKDEAYLSTSPWQIMSFEAENKYKQSILTETYLREHVNFGSKIPMYAGKSIWHYRNKMEYSFWADDFGLHLALFNRGTHQKQTIEGSSIAMPAVDVAAQKIVSILSKNSIRGSQLKSVIVRSNQNNQTAAALFVKDENFPDIPELQEVGQGVAVYFSNPKSPASVVTKQLFLYGDVVLQDTVLGSTLHYDVNSFFQVNLEIFEQAARSIGTATEGITPVVDMFSGVGSIGLSINATQLVEIDKHNIEMAKRNGGDRPVEVIHAAAENALQYIPHDGSLIVDPPRAGLHSKFIDALRETQPKKLIYLSCNPITQARDLALLQDLYNITSIEGYNFFPRTPHIESLAILERI